MRAQVFKQGPGADIEPGWYAVRQRAAAGCNVPMAAATGRSPPGERPSAKRRKLTREKEDL
jgi:hypothetical protein